MSKKKKIVIMSTLVLLLAVTAILNVFLATGKGAGTASAVTTSNYFTTFRTERATTRSEEIMQYDSVINLYDKESEDYANAVASKLDVIKMMEKELLIETLIKSKGFSDAVVTIGAESQNVNVFINSDELNYNTAMAIYTMIVDELNVEPGSVIILPVYSQI